MIVVIQDANILIDLADVGLLSAQARDATKGHATHRRWRAPQTRLRRKRQRSRRPLDF